MKEININGSVMKCYPLTAAQRLHHYTVNRSYTSADAYSDETVVQSFNIHSATQSWNINKKYSFTITVDLNQIYWAPSVEDWEDGTSAEVGIN